MATILIVDDDVVMRELMRHVLLRAGYKTLEARTGRAAVDLAKSMRPTLILLDLMLPILNGFQVLSELRHFPGTAKTPIIMVTSSSDDQDEERALKEGANGYITKPFRPRQLLEHVQLELNRWTV